VSKRDLDITKYPYFIMAVKIRYLGLVYRITGLYEEELDVETPITVKTLLIILFKKYGKLRDLILLDGNRLNPLYRILVNGRDLEHLNGLDTVLKDGDLLTISTPFGG